MAVRYFALVMGIVFAVIGIAGLFPGLRTPLEEPLVVDEMSGRLFGLFPVNILHNLVHLLFGVWGVVAYRTFAASRGYARFVAIAYAFLAVLGFIPVLSTVFGLVPIYGHDIWLHVLIAAAAAYFGWAHADAKRRVAT